jgi:hypothetical protein
MEMAGEKSEGFEILTPTVVMIKVQLFARCYAVSSGT